MFELFAHVSPNKGRTLVLSAAERKSRSLRMSARAKTNKHRQHLAKITSSRAHAERMVARNKSAWANPVYREKQIARIRAMQPRLKEQKSKLACARWRDPKFREKFYKGLMARFGDRSKPSQLHLRLKAAMDRAGLHNLSTHVVVGYFCVDEADSVLKLAVEVNGCYWHACALCYNNCELTECQRRNREQDKRKTAYLVRHGWRLLTLWEHELSDGKTAVRRIVAFMEERHEKVTCNRH